MLVRFRLPMELAHLAQDPEIRRRVENAYANQVECNHGWGFTVTLNGLRCRFDVEKSAVAGNGGLGVLYVGDVVEGLNEDQTEQLRLNLQKYEKQLQARMEMTEK
jgi:hypothetical protein